MKRFETQLNSAYAEEDKRNIALLAEEIAENAQYVKGIYKIMPKRISVEDKKNHMYAFYGEKELSLALYLFYASRYNARMIAKKCYWGDLDEIIKESMDCYDFAVGRVRSRDQTSKESRLVEAKMKILNFREGIRDKNTNMPFELMGFRIISDDDVERSNLTKEEAYRIAEKRVTVEYNAAEREYECQRRGIRAKLLGIKERKLVEAIAKELLNGAI